MTYDEAITITASEIIDNKDYTRLETILENYDMIFKKGNPLENYNLPFWFYCCTTGDSNER